MQADKTANIFIDIIHEHERLIYKVCSIYAKDSDDRKDLYQEVVLQAWRAWPKFRAEAKVSTWLYRIALNTAISRQRRPAVKAHYGESILMDIADPVDGMEHETYRQLYAAISRLNDMDRALVLLYLEDKSHQEIAEIMGISVSNVGTRLARVKDKMKKIMFNNQ
ncbi:MAG TPA: sigma-70 family RNA polymerase sigma factor [Flavipsychrobacter sp.]|nr:sigma-70 family RNA polymerase sigma factor [Flavipsychrobacter sp.]